MSLTSKKQVKTPTRQSEVESSSGNKRRDGRTIENYSPSCKKMVNKKSERKTESSDRSRLEHITNASPVRIPCDDQCRGEKLLDSKESKGKVTCNYVPVVSSTGTPLMPCHQARARQLLKEKKAIKRFTNGIFYIKLVDRTDGEVQKVACGIDPGSKREGFTVKDSKRTFINVLSETNPSVSKKVEVRKNSRKNRRRRKTPYRKCKCRRKRNGPFLPPSTRSRWNAKLRIVSILRKIYPISNCVVEDLKAVTKEGKKKWNKSFSPLEIGKKYFYDEIRKISKLTLIQGYETADIRNKLGLIKTKSKLSNSFKAHNVDSWVLANSIFNIQTKPDYIGVLKFTPTIIHRRQLHYYQPGKNGKRGRYGGTVSLGIPKGTVCRYRNKYFTIGGNLKGKMSLNSMVDNKRITQTAVLNEIELMNYILRWNVKKV